VRSGKHMPRGNASSLARTGTGLATALRRGRIIEKTYDSGGPGLLSRTVVEGDVPFTRRHT